MSINFAGYDAVNQAFGAMQSAIVMVAKDVIVPTSIEEQAISWLTTYYQKNADMQIVENAHQPDNGATLTQC